MSKQIVSKNVNQSVTQSTAPQAVPTGQKTIVKIVKGQHLRVQDVVEQQAKDASNVVVTKDGQALHLKFADGTEIRFDGFYDECGGNACSVTLGGKAEGGYVIDGDTAVGAATSDGGHLVYAYGEHSSLMALASGDTGMSAALGGLGEGTVVYVPGAAALAGGIQPGALAGIGGGLALVGGGGGGAAAVATPIVSVVTGTIVAGPVVDGHGLTVEVYAADGTTLLGTATVDANGQFTVNVGSYTGVVIARLVDADDGADYMDESTGAAKDMNANFMAIAVVPGGTVTVNINALTTVAAIKAGVSSDGTVSTALTSISVENANAAVADAFGLSNLLGEAIVTTVDTTGGANSAYDTTDGLSNAEKYGVVLAALSGADANNGGDAQATIDAVASGLTVDGGNGTLDASATDTVVAGAQTTDPSNSQTLVNIVSDSTTQTSATLAIHSVANDNIINASETGAVVSGTAAANATLTLTLGSGNTRSVTADANGDWSYSLQADDITAMGQGPETMGVSDGSSTATRGIYIDTVAPTTHFGAATDNVGSVTGALTSGQTTDDTALVLSGTCEAGSTVNVYDGTTLLGAATVTGTSWSYTATVADGSTYQFNVKEMDAAGNTSAASSNFTVIGDTSAPTANFGAATDDVGSVTGALTSGQTTDDTSLVLSGTCEAGSTVNIYNGATLLGSATVTGTSWSYTAMVADGTTYQFNVTETDAAGNTSAATSNFTVIGDTTAPTTPASAPASYQDNAGSITSDTSTAGTTDDTTPGINVGAGLTDTPSLYVDGVKVAATYDNSTGTLTPDTALSEGAHNFTYTLTDAAGNESGQSPALSITLDTTAPTLTVSAVDISADTGTSATDFLTKTAAQNITGTLSAALATGDILYGSVDGGSTWTDITNMVSNDTAINWTGATLSGSSSIVFKVSDAAGNDSANTGSTAYVLDTTVAAPTLALANDTGSSNSDGRTDDATVNVSGLESGATWEYSLNGGTNWSTGSGTSFELADNTLYAAEAIQVRQTDAAGNTSVIGSNAAAIVTDMSGPVINGVLTSGGPMKVGDVITATIFVSDDSGVPYTNLTGTIGGFALENLTRLTSTAYSATFTITEGGTDVTSGGSVPVSMTLQDEFGRVSSTYNTPIAATQPITDNSTTLYKIYVDSAENAANLTSVGFNVVHTYDSDLIFTLYAPDGSSILLVSEQGGGGDNFTNTVIATGGTSLSSGSAPFTGTYEPEAPFSGLTGAARGVWTLEIQDTAGDDSGYLTTWNIVLPDYTGSMASATIDANSPTQTIDAVDISNDTGTSATDFITSAASQTITGTLSAALATGDILYGSLDNGDTWTDITSKVSGTAISWNGATLSGSSSIVFKVTDAAGNNSANTGSTAYVLDTTAPVDPSVAEQTTTDLADGKMNAAEAVSTTFRVTLPTTGSTAVAGDRVELLLDGAAFGTPKTVTLSSTDISNGYVDFSVLAADLGADGDKSLTAKITDVAGNVSSASTAVTFTLDTTAPTLTVSAVVISADTGTSASDFFTNTSAQTITSTLSAALDTGDILYGSLDGGSTWTDITSKVSGPPATSINWNGVTLNASGTILFKVTDAAGNDNATSGSTAYVLDTTVAAPTLALASDTGSSNSDGITNNGTVNVGNLETGATWEYSTNGGTGWTPGSGTTFTLAETTYNAGDVQVRQTDAAGNTSSPASNAASITVETTPPTQTAAVTAITDDVAGVTGTVASGGITNDTQLLISGTLSVALSDQSVRVYDGSTYLGDATVTGTTWTYTDTRTLTDGQNISYTVRVASLAGNEGAVGTAYTATVDTLAPTTPASAAASYQDNAGSLTSDTSTAGITDDTTPGINVGAGLTDTPSLYVDGIKVAATYDSSTGMLTPDTALSEGEHNFTYTLTDAVGNESGQSPALGITVDTTAPTAPASAPASYQDNAGSLTSNTSTAGITDDTTPGINVGAGLTDTPSLYVDGIKVAATYDSSTGTLTPDTALSEGAHNFTYTLTDAVGNESGQSPALTITVDTTAPTLTVSAVDISADTGTSDSDFLTNTAAQTITGTLSAALDTGDILYGSLDNGTTWTDITSKASGTAISWDGATLNASGTILFKVTDAAGNDSATSGSQAYTLDTAVATPNAVLTTDAGSSNSDALTNSGAITAPTNTEAGAVVEYRVSTDAGSTFSAWSTTYTPPATDGSADGAYVVEVRQTDAANNVSASQTISFTLETTPPADLIVSLLTDSGISDSDYITNINTIQVTGLEPGATWEYSMDGGATWSDGPSDHFDVPNNRTYTASTFQVRQTDAAGNTSNVTSNTVDYIIDTTPPTTTAAVTTVTDDVGTIQGDIDPGTPTDDTRPTISGTLSAPLEAGEAVHIYDSGVYIGDATVTGNTWTYQVTSDLTEPHTFSYTARVGDQAGNQSLAGQSFDGRVDTSAIGPSLILAHDTGTDSYDRVTNDGTMNVGYVEEGATWQYSTDGGESWSAPQAYTVTSFTLAPGVYDHEAIQVRQTDVAGNLSGVTRYPPVTVDITPSPFTAAVMAISDNVGTVQGTVASGGTTDDTQLLISGTVSAALNGEVVRIYDGSTYLGDAEVTDTTWTYTDTRTLTDGQNISYTARVASVAGNEGAVGTAYTATVDLSGPTVTITPADATSDTTPVISGTAENGVTVTVTVGGATYTAIASGGTWSVDTGTTPSTGTLALTEGDNTVSVTATDAAGNSTPTSATLVLDTTPPSAPVLAGGGGGQDDPQTLAIGPDGRYVLAWCEVTKLYVQQFNADGTAHGSPMLIDSEAWSQPLLAAVGSNGDYVMTWTATESTQSSEKSVFVQKFNADGSLAGSKQKLEAISNLSGNDYASDVAAIGSNGAFVVSFTGYNSSVGGFEVYVQSFTANGEKHGLTYAAQYVNAYEFGGGVLVEALGSAGAFVVAWNGVDRFTGASSIYVQQFNVDGSKPADSLVKLAGFGGSDGESNWSPAISAIGSTGEYVLTWQGRNSANGSSIFVQKFNADGSLAGTTQKLDALDTQSYDGSPSICAVGSHGDFVLVWDGVDSVNVGERRILIQKFDNAGNTVGAALKLEIPDAAYVKNKGPLVTALGTDGAYVVVWTALDDDIGLDPDGEGDWSVFVQKFNADGSALPLVKIEPPDIHNLWDYAAQVTAVGSDGAFIVTYVGEINDDGKHKVFVQRFAADGTKIVDPLLIEYQTGNLQIPGSETSTAYLVSSSLTVSSLADITNAADSLWNSVAITQTSTPTNLGVSGLPTGDYLLYIADAAGNLSPASEIPIRIVDTTAPTTTLSNIDISADTGSSDSDFLTKTAVQNLSATLSASLADGEILYGSVNGGLTWTDITSKVSGTTLSWVNLTLSGSNTIKLKVTDAAGNDGIVASQNYVLDTTAPSANLSTATYQGNGLYTLSGTREEGSTVDVYNGNTLLDAAIVSGGTNDYRWYYDIWVTDGTTYDFNVKETDAAGNTSAASSTITVIGDTTKPIATLTAATVENSGNITVRSSEAGSAYLVNTNLTVNALSYITSAANNLWNSVNVTANTDTTLAASGLVAGTYRLYTVDATGNLSEASADTVTISATPLRLSNIANANGGFVINGTSGSDASGVSVSSAGDVNGDGLADLIVGAYMASPTAGTVAGKSYVVFGKADTVAIELSAVADGNGGFVINGQSASDWSGWSVSAAGDVNGDGLADLIIGAPYADPTAGISAGKSYVVFGKTDTTAVELSSIADGNGGFVINGQSLDDRSGWSVSTAGDVNGDGLADLIVGANGANSEAGKSYVVFGKTNTAAIELSAIADGNGGFVINGQSASDWSGWSVSAAGDVNGDGLADLIVGAYQADPTGRSDAGKSYVVFGKTNTAAIELSAIATGNGGFVINGQSANDYSGYSVSAAGDVNGDGLADLIVGANGANSGAGKSYVVFGKTNTAAIELSAIADGAGRDGFVINGESANDDSGYSVSVAGDINGDGLADLIVGARGANSGAGKSYVVFGKPDAATIELSAIAAGSGGFVITGQNANDWSGGSVSAAGDVNGDGLADLIVGASRATPGSSVGAGKSYVIFGSTDGAFAGATVDQMGTAGDDSLSDDGRVQTLVGNAGNDTFTATAASVLYGGSGNDTFIIDNRMISALMSPLGSSDTKLARIDGGSGIDTIVLSSYELNLDWVATQAASNPDGGSRINSVEVIDLSSDSRNNIVKLTALDVLDMSGFDSFEHTGRHQLLIKGSDIDTLDLNADSWGGTTGWTQSGTITYDGITYNAWNHDTKLATVYVDQNTNVI